MSTETEIKLSNQFYLTTSPHMHSKQSAKKVMWTVVISLLPSVIAAVLFFGVYQLVIMLVSVVFANLTEAAVQAIRKKKITVYDGSASITGIILALTLPPNFSLSAAAIGAVVAVGLGKQIFGGLGYNIFNPALVGRAFLQAAFPVAITTWTKPGLAVDGITSATPLAAFKFDKIVASTGSMFWGNTGGSMGETSAAAILIGGIFLIAAGISNWRIPVSIITSLVIFGGIFRLIDPVKYPDPVFQLLAGGLLFGAFFMATDWVTSPITGRGMWIFGFGIGAMVVVIRLFGGLPEGVMYSILFMNAFVPLINRFTVPRIFGSAEGAVR